MENTIINDIRKCARDFTQNNRGTPTRIYLGRGETLLLGQWAYSQGYFSKPDTPANEEGINRPEVEGLKVYEVNDNRPHMVCAP